MHSAQSIYIVILLNFALYLEAKRSILCQVLYIIGLGFVTSWLSVGGRRHKMAEVNQVENKWWSPETVAVVTGGNRGIGLEVVRQLAEKGIKVVLTARHTYQGLSPAARDLLERLGKGGFSVFFHSLDVQSPQSVSIFAEWLEKELGHLDILINNAGVGGTDFDWDLLQKRNMDFRKIVNDEYWTEGLTETHETAKECVDVNYNGTKRVTKALIPLLKPSAHRPRIVNVSSYFGLLALLRSEALQKRLSDIENISEEIIDSTVNEFLEDMKKGLKPREGVWPVRFPSYSVSKVALNAYTRLLGRDLDGKVSVNSVHPGFVRTDMTFNAGDISCVEGAENVVKVALLPEGGVSGRNFFEKEIVGF